MKRTLILFTLYLFVIQHGILYPYDTSAARYFPLSVGNCWTYYHFQYPYGGSNKYKVSITGTTVTNNHLYYIFSSGYLPQYLRVDSVKNSVMVYDSTAGCPWLNHEHMLDSLTARIGDSSSFNCSMFYIVTDTSNYSIFNITKKRLTTSWTNHFEAGGNRTLAKDFGFVGSYDFGHTQTSTVTLLGCVINGVLYGDTSLTGVNLISSEVPTTLSLSQNYPNPFNPSTTIKFDIPVKRETSNVKLIIYDVLGRVATTLIDQQMQPGSYSVDWDASNYPSGVYFYRIEIGDFVDSKKMVLIK